MQLLKFKFKISQFFLRRQLAKETKDWNLLVSSFMYGYQDHLKALENDPQIGRILVGSSRLDYDAGGDRSIIEGYLIDLAKELDVKLKVDDIKEHWIEMVENALDSTPFEIAWDSNDLLYYISNPHYTYCNHCGKQVKWGGDGDDAFCIICKNEVYLD